MALGAMPIVTASSSRNEPWLSLGLHPANKETILSIQFLPTTATPAMAHSSSHGQVHFFSYAQPRVRLSPVVGYACICHALKETLWLDLIRMA
jgi:hypothetical protein